MAQILVIVGLSLALAVMIALYVETPALLNQHWRYACRPSVFPQMQLSFTHADIDDGRWAQRENNIVHWTEFDHGGHFAALEVPKVLVDDLRKLFCQLLISNKDTSS